MRCATALLLLALTSAAAHADRATWPIEVVRRPPWLPAGLCEASLVAEANLSPIDVWRPVSLAPDLECGAGRVTVGITHSARSLSLIDSGNGLCLTGGEEGNCPRPYDGGAFDLRVPMPGGELVRVAMRARLVARSLEPFKPSARLGALVRLGGAGRVSLLADPHIALSLAAEELGNRDFVALPLTGQLQLGRHLTLELISGVRGELHAFDEVFAVPIAFGVIATPTAALDIGLEGGWTKLLGPQNTFKQRHAALLVTYRFGTATPPPPAASYRAR